MSRILTISVGSLVATAAFLAASLATSAGDSAAEEYRGAMIRQSVEGMPDPDRCGPSGSASSATWLGRDTLGGAFEMSTSVCLVFVEPETLRVFDVQGTGRYILPSGDGEEWTLRAEDYSIIASPFPTCVQVPEKPVKFTFSDFTGEHAGERVVGHYDSIAPSSLCGGITPDPSSIFWFDGVFTPNGGGLPGDDDDDDDDDGDDDDDK